METNQLEDYVEELNSAEKVEVEYFLSADSEKQIFSKNMDQLFREGILCAEVRLDAKLFSKEYKNLNVRTFLLIKKKASSEMRETFRKKATKHDYFGNQNLEWKKETKKKPMLELLVLVHNFEKIITNNRFKFLKTRLGKDIQELHQKVQQRTGKRRIPKESLGKYVQEMLNCQSWLGLELLRTLLAQKNLKLEKEQSRDLVHFLLQNMKLDMDETSKELEEIFFDLRKFKDQLKKITFDITQNEEIMVHGFIFKKGERVGKQIKNVLKYQKMEKWDTNDKCIEFIRRIRGFQQILESKKHAKPNLLKLTKQFLKVDRAKISIEEFAVLTLLVEFASAKNEGQELHKKLKEKSMKIGPENDLDLVVWVGLYLSYNSLIQANYFLSQDKVKNFLVQVESFLAENQSEYQKKFKLVRRWIEGLEKDTQKEPKSIIRVLRSQEALLFAFLVAQEKQKSSVFMKQLRDFINGEEDSAEPSVTWWVWVLYPFKSFWRTKGVKSSVCFPYFENLFGHFLIKENQNEDNHFLRRFEWAKDQHKVAPGDVLLSHNSLDRLSLVCKSRTLTQEFECSDLQKVTADGTSEMNEDEYSQIKRNLERFMESAENSLFNKLSQNSQIFKFVFNGTEQSFAKVHITQKYFERFLKSRSASNWSSFIADYFFQPPKSKQRVT